MPADRNLVILHTPMNEDESDWLRVRSLIGERAPDIEVRIVGNDRRDPDAERWQATRPSLVFAVCPLWEYRPAGGKVYAGQAMSKLEETERLRLAGVPTPKTTRLKRDLRLDPTEWGDYVVVKPARGSFGRDVHLVPTAEVAARFDSIVDPKDGVSLVQSFVEHVDDQGRPTTHRVLTLFGKALYAIRSSWREARAAAAEVAAGDGLLAANSAEKDRIRELLDDPEIVALAERAAAAVPEVPALGVDVVRETNTGKLYVLELNASGTVWHLSSQTGKTRYPGTFRRRLYRQFNALDRVADLLIARTRAEAR
jgi:hypothetical protein